MKYLKYYVAQQKRMLIFAVGVFPTAMLLFASLVLCVYLLFMKGVFAGETQKYSIGVVGDTDETYLGFGINAVQTLDSTRFVIEFLPMTQEEAREKFLAGEITTYVTIEDGFVDSLVYGRNDVPVTYVATEGQKGLAGYFMEEVSKVASKIVISSQSSIYAMQAVFRKHGQTKELSRLTDVINLKLIEYVLSRTKLAKLEELGFSGGISTRDYYFCSVILFFCFLFGTCSAPVFLGRNEQLAKWMKVRGVGALGQVLCEYVPYFLLLLICTVVPLCALGKVTEGFAFLDYKLGIRDVLLTLVPLGLMISAMQFMLYELFWNPVANLLIQFVAVIGMSYVSGFFFPASFFPDGLVLIGRGLPTGRAFAYFSELFLGKTPGRFDGFLFLYFVIFLMIAVCGRIVRIHAE